MSVSKRTLVIAVAVMAFGQLAAFGQQGRPTNVDPSLLDEFGAPGQGPQGGAGSRGASATNRPTRNPTNAAAGQQTLGPLAPPPVEAAVEPAANAGGQPLAVAQAPNRLFLALDANNDGFISVAELRRAVNATRSLDTNEDGNISLAEAGGGAAGAAAGAPGAVAGAMTPADQALAQYDKNGDGKLTANETPPELARMFSQMDANRDGELTRDELNAAAASMSAMGPGGMMMGPGGAVGGGLNQIMQYDRNRDNRITPDEVPPQLAAMLRGADRNGDGAIDLQEIGGMAQQAQGMSPANRGFGPGGEVPPAAGRGNGNP